MRSRSRTPECRGCSISTSVSGPSFAPRSAVSRRCRMSCAGRIRATPGRRRAITLRRRWAMPRPARAALIVVCGLPASGKSTIAKALAERSGFPVFNSDVIRKRLVGKAPTIRAGADWRQGIYGPQFTAATYAGLLDEAATTLKSGTGAIIDATFKDDAERLHFAIWPARWRCRSYSRSASSATSRPSHAWTRARRSPTRSRTRPGRFTSSTRRCSLRLPRSLPIVI